MQCAGLSGSGQRPSRALLNDKQAYKTLLSEPFNWVVGGVFVPVLMVLAWRSLSY